MLSLSSAERAQLATATDRAVIDSLDGTLTGWRGHAPANEPDAVAAVVSAGMPAAAPGWTAVLKPRRLSAQIIGVFCHQTPKVDFVDAGGASRSCELADLLIVVDDAGVAGNVRDRRALLVQAKIAHRPALALSGGDLVQFDLLSRWPTFKFSAALYPNNWRDIGGAGTPPGISDSACYGAIDLLPKVVRWEQLAVASLTIGSGRSFGETMADMSAGLDGREAIPGGADDWSDTVDELLRTTYQAIAGGFAGSPQRGVTSIASLAPPTGIGVAFHPPGGGSPPGRGERQDGPISVVHVRLERNEDG